MLLNYIKVGFRNIIKNKLSTFINAVGMALAIGCSLIAFQFIYWWTHLDDFHSKRDEIYILQREMATNGSSTIWNDVPQPLGKALKEEFSQIESVARINYNRGTIKLGENIFSEWVSFVDPTYHELFDFDIKWGNRSTFSDMDGIVLSEAIAEKYFGDRNPVGETLNIRFTIDAKEVLEEFTIKGVLEEVPNNASFSDNILLPFDRQKSLVQSMEDWTYRSTITFLQIKQPKEVAALKTKEQKYLAQINQSNENWNMTGLHFQPLATIAQNGYKSQNNPFHTSHISAIVMLAIIAFILLLLVCFNYINITLASATSRLKEISVRKVLGSNRRQIIWQFLTENILICIFSLCIGILLATYLFIPWFNRLSNNTLEISYLNQPSIWGFTTALIIIAAIGGAGYPALYISKFQPVKILKKEFQMVKKNRFQKFLIGIQLLITIITIFSTIVLFFTSQHLRKKDWGYNQHDVVVIPLQNEGDFEKFQNDIQQHPNIIGVTGSQERMGDRIYPVKVQVAGVEHEVQKLTVASNYTQTLGMILSNGRDFDPDLEIANQEAVLVNAAFRRKMNWNQVMGKQIKIEGKTYRVIGEVQDFHLQDFFVDIKPLVFQTNTEQNYRYISARTIPGAAEQVARDLESNWKEIYPSTPYTFYFQDAAFDNYFYHFRQVNAILSASSFMTVLVAIIGLFGFAMLLLNRKMKELSIHKVLGANTFQLSQLITREFLIPVLIATLIGLPIGFFMLKGLLSQIAPSTAIGWIPFLITIITVISILAISLGKHIYTAIVINPARLLNEG